MNLNLYHESLKTGFNIGFAAFMNQFAHHHAPLTPHGKLRWHSRRGMLELDILLQRFWEKFGDRLSAADGDDLENLLEYEDNDLLALILGDASETGEIASRVLQMLRAG